MTRYQTRNGVVLTSVKGGYLLVSAKAARDKCPYVTQVNETAALIWKTLEEGADAKKCVEAIENEYEIDDPNRVMAEVVGLISQLEEAGFLIRLPEGGSENE